MNEREQVIAEIKAALKDHPDASFHITGLNSHFSMDLDYVGLDTARLILDMLKEAIAENHKTGRRTS